MNICLCLSWYFPDSIGGTETYVHSLALFLKGQGHLVNVLKPGSKNEQPYFYENIKVHSFYPGKHFSKQMYLGLESPDVSDFEAKLRELLPDVVHFHSLTGPAGITIFHVEKAKLIAPKIFFTFHLPHLTCATSTFKYLKNYDCDGVAGPDKCAVCLFTHRGWPVPAAKVLGDFSNLLNDSKIKVLGHTRFFSRLGSAESISLRKEQLEQLSNTCDKLICLSSWFYEVLKKNTVKIEKVVLIEQGLPMNSTEFISRKKESTIPSIPVRLVYLGRLDPIKGLSLLLSVINEFHNNEYLLDLYGPVANKYLQQLKPYFAKKNIRYKGLLSRNEVLPALSEYDAVIVPSLVTEMAPLVLQEAFAAGTPAIASDVAGNAAFVRPGLNGWLFKTGDKESLKELLSRLLKNQKELTAFSGNLSFVRTMKNIGREHLELYVTS
ncbi:MAG: glycosyltransferase [Segetibacter sp.]|nr:glycosyltransferase [Segetibacter sp.]